jgi:hypothetical protein
VASVAVAACGGDERAARQQAAERAQRDEAVEVGRRAAAAPATGRWTEEHLLDRLVRAGVAPRRQEGGTPGAGWMGVAPIRLLAGGGEVIAWIYPDSAARRAVTDVLDPATGTPPATTSPYPSPMRFIVQNNLAAVVFGGTVTNQERIALALEAGLPVSGTTP